MSIRLHCEWHIIHSFLFVDDAVPLPPQLYLCHRLHRAEQALKSNSRSTGGRFSQLNNNHVSLQQYKFNDLLHSREDLLPLVHEALSVEAVVSTKHAFNLTVVHALGQVAP